MDTDTDIKALSSRVTMSGGFRYTSFCSTWNRKASRNLSDSVCRMMMLRMFITGLRSLSFRSPYSVAFNLLQISHYICQKWQIKLA